MILTYNGKLYSLLNNLVTGCASSDDQTSKEEHSSGEHQELSAPVLTYEMGSDDCSAITTYSDSPKVLEAYQLQSNTRSP
jgi:hypothetical protein